MFTSPRDEALTWLENNGIDERMSREEAELLIGRSKLPSEVRGACYDILAEWRNQDNIREAAAFALGLAQRHRHEGVMATSADLCCNDAEQAFRQERWGDCFARAIKSLKYSVGIFGDSFRQVASL